MAIEQQMCRHCGEVTQGGEYLPGHDSYHASELAAGVATGEIDDAWARSQMPPGVLRQYEAWLPGKLAKAWRKLG